MHTSHLCFDFRAIDGLRAFSRLSGRFGEARSDAIQLTEDGVVEGAKTDEILEDCCIACFSKLGGIVRSA